MAPLSRHLEVTPEKVVGLSSRVKGQHLFVSATSAFPNQAVIVVLSGCGDYGAEVLSSAKANVAVIIAEDPNTASACCAPKAAITTGLVDFIVPLELMATTISEVVLSQLISVCD